MRRVLFGPATESGLDARGASPIWAFDQEASPTLLDSAEALRRAEAAGGAAFRERTGAALGELRLCGRGPGWSGPHRWSVAYGRWYPRTGLTIWLDAQTGTVLDIEEQPEPPPAPAATD